MTTGCDEVGLHTREWAFGVDERVVVNVNGRKQAIALSENCPTGVSERYGDFATLTEMHDKSATCNGSSSVSDRPSSIASLPQCRQRSSS